MKQRENIDAGSINNLCEGGSNENGKRSAAQKTKNAVPWSTLAELEAFIQKKGIDKLNIQKNAKALDDLCVRMGLERLVGHPYILGTWARVKHELGQHYQAINFARSTIGLLEESKSGDFVSDQYCIMARAHLALSDSEEALSCIKKARTLAKYDLQRQFRVNLLSVRIYASRGELGQAEAIAQKLIETNKAPEDTIYMRAILSALKLVKGEFTPEDLRALSDVESVDIEALDMPERLRHAYALSRLIFAHVLAQKGQYLRAQTLLSPNPFSKEERAWNGFIKAELLACQEKYEDALKELKGLLHAGHNLSNHEKLPIFWLQALIVFAQKDIAQFEAHAHKFNNVARGNMHLRWRQKAHALVALAAALNNEPEQSHAYLVGSGALDDNAATEARLLAYVSQAARAEKSQEVEKYIQTFRNSRPSTLLDDSSSLCAKLLCQGDTRLFQYLFKAEGDSSSFVAFLARTHVHETVPVEELSLLAKDERAQLSNLLGSSAVHSETNVNPGMVRYGFSMLGSFNLQVEGRQISLDTWRKSKTRELFIALAVDAQRDIAAEEIIERLWPGRCEKDGHNNYYVTLSKMKKHLSTFHDCLAQGIVAHNKGAGNFLKAENCFLDVREFDVLVKMARLAHVKGDNEEALLKFSLAAQLYCGDLLPGDTSIEWLAPIREHYHTMFVEAMIRATEICLKIGDLDRAVHFIESGLALEKSREILYELAMRVYAQATRREDAIRSYHACRRYLSEELGLDPSKRLKQLYGELLKD